MATPEDEPILGLTLEEELTAYLTIPFATIERALEAGDMDAKGAENARTREFDIAHELLSNPANGGGDGEG